MCGVTPLSNQRRQERSTKEQFERVLTKVGPLHLTRTVLLSLLLHAECSSTAGGCCCSSTVREDREGDVRAAFGCSFLHNCSCVHAGCSRAPSERFQRRSCAPRRRVLQREDSREVVNGVFRRVVEGGGGHVPLCSSDTAADEAFRRKRGCASLPSSLLLCRQ